MASRSDVRNRLTLINNGEKTPEADILLVSPSAPRWIDVLALSERVGTALISNRIDVDSGENWRHWHALKRLISHGWLIHRGGFSHAAQSARAFQLSPSGLVAVRMIELVSRNRCMWPDKGKVLVAVISADRSDLSFDVSMRDFSQLEQ